MDHGRILRLDTPSALVRALDAPVRIQVAAHRVDEAALGSVPGVDEVAVIDGQVVLTTRRAGPALGWLAEHDALEGLQVRGAGLEDVFLDLTGREYRA